MSMRAGRRAATIVCGFAVAAGVLPAGAAGQDATDQQIRQAIDLTAADVPGFEASPFAPRDSEAKNTPTCGETPLQHADTGWPHPFMRQKPFAELHSQVWVLGAPRAAARAVRVVARPSFGRCMARSLARALAGEKRLRVTRVTAHPLAVHPPSMAGIRLRVGATVGNGHAINVIDLRWLAHDRAVVLLETSTIEMPYSAADADRLMGLLAQRAAVALP